MEMEGKIFQTFAIGAPLLIDAKSLLRSKSHIGYISYYF